MWAAETYLQRQDPEAQVTGGGYFVLKQAERKASVAYAGLEYSFAQREDGAGGGTVNRSAAIAGAVERSWTRKSRLWMRDGSSRCPDPSAAAFVRPGMSVGWPLLKRQPPGRMKMRKYTEEQLEAIHSLEQNTVVSPAPVVVKTSVLGNAIFIFATGNREKPVSTQEILAITFYRKAATEMRQRTQRHRCQTASPGEEHAYWQEQPNLDKAPDWPIHSLCNSILKNNPVESNLDPSLVVAEERDADVFLETQRRKTLSGSSCGHPEVLQLAGEQGGVRFPNQVTKLICGKVFFTAGCRFTAWLKRFRFSGTEQAISFQQTCRRPGNGVVAQNWQTVAGKLPTGAGGTGWNRRPEQRQLLAATGDPKANSKTDRELVKAIRKPELFPSIPCCKKFGAYPGLAALLDGSAGVCAKPEGRRRTFIL